MILKLLLNTGMIWMISEKDNSIKNRKILIAFDDMIADVLSNKKLYPLVTKLFIGTFYFKHSSYYFYIQSYFGFLLFAKSMGKIIGKKMIKNLSGKYSQFYPCFLLKAWVKLLVKK